MLRQLTTLDRIIIECDKAIKTVIGAPETSERMTPGYELPENELTAQEQEQSSRLMRVNHSGEVSAQALYQGQALTATLPKVKAEMERAALEENDHLVWCQQRLTSLGTDTSLLNPLWYVGSFTLGAVAGKMGDKWSLGFVAETEKQVAAHLDEHLDLMTESDIKSRAVLEQMKIDELHHGSTAMAAGGAELPIPVRVAMGFMSKVMTKSSYWI